LAVTTYPLVFSFSDVIVGNGFVAHVAASGRVILADEGDGDIWMFGVQPGGVAGGGRERSQAFYEFKKNYRSVLFDIAIESSTYEDLESAVSSFFSEINQTHLEMWTEAVQAVRAGKLSLPDLRSENADLFPSKIEIRRLDCRDASCNDNSFDEIRKAA